MGSFCNSPSNLAVPMEGLSFDLCQWLQWGGPSKNKWVTPTIGWIPHKFSDELYISLANTQMVLWSTFYEHIFSGPFLIISFSLLVQGCQIAKDPVQTWFVDDWVGSNTCRGVTLKLGDAWGWKNDHRATLECGQGRSHRQIRKPCSLVDLKPRFFSQT